ncbi:hypothetical protein Taro_053928 [Colocasia esculenta]|uniref:Uncharacterized protein n=1 Tax=Colocasia esculenta TaxID=4460 RepID=A0A843XPM9_COLES|nr:hypothetical protein [Colocasia esculenta]
MTTCGTLVQRGPRRGSSRLLLLLLGLPVGLPLNPPPLMGWTLELIHCQSDLVLLGSLLSLERVLQLVRPTLCLVWIILTEEHRQSEMQEPLQEGGPVLSYSRPPLTGSGTPST